MTDTDVTTLLETGETTQYGVVFVDNSHDIYEDLVGPTYPDIGAATEAAVEGKALSGREGALVFRDGPEGEWLTVYSRLTPIAWIQQRRGLV